MARIVNPDTRVATLDPLECGRYNPPAMKQTHLAPTGALADLRVLELGTLIAGPFCARLLAEFGAEVIKIESPDGGDQLRGWRKMYPQTSSGDAAATSLWWYVQARNKKSVTVNLRAPEGQEIVRRLARGADIVIENFRPGALEKWNIGWEQLSALN